MTPKPPAEVRRIVYMGTPELAVAPLLTLHEAGYEIPLVISRPDARRSRRGTPQPSPVKAAALDLGIPVSDSVADTSEVNADLAVVVAYGRIIPTDLLDGLAMVNIHFSLLPRWRGAAPVERAIMAGDARTGVCLMAVEPELDTGAVYRRDETVIADDDTLETLRGRLVEIGCTQLIEALAEGFGVPEPQVGDPVYAEKIRSSELEIDWSGSAVEANRLIRVGGAWTTWRNKRFKIISALVMEDPSGGEVAPKRRDPGVLDGTVVSTGDGSLLLLEVQPEGKGRQLMEAWANGARPQADERFGA